MTREPETETTEAAAASAPASTAPVEPTTLVDVRAVGADAPQTRALAVTAEPAAAAPSSAATGATPPEVQAAAERARAEERHRIATIQDAARKLGVAASVADDLVARGTSVHAARAALIDAAAARDAHAETRPHVRTGGLDASETRRAAVEAALLHRYDPGRFALSEPAREWRGLSLIEMARGWLEVEGVRVRGLSRDEIATRALHSTSDFPAILAGVTNKTLRNTYETAPRTYPAIARRTTVADFKLVHRLKFGEAPQLEKVSQSGEFKRGSIGEAQETYRIETFGKVIGITRQVLINDDLDAFARVPALFGTSAAALRERRGLGHLHRQSGDGRRHDAVPRRPEPRQRRCGARRRRARQGADRHRAAARPRRQDAAERPALLSHGAKRARARRRPAARPEHRAGEGGGRVPTQSAASRSSPTAARSRPARCLAS